jgi:hypothetical protein
MLFPGAKDHLMNQAARRNQPPITIRSARAAALLRRLAGGGRSQVDIIEEALERMAAQRQTLSEALAPELPQDFDWEPARSNVAGRIPDLAD